MLADLTPIPLTFSDPKVGRAAGAYYRPYAGETGAWLTVVSAALAESYIALLRRNRPGDRPGCSAQSPAHLPIRPAAEKSAPRHPLLLGDQSFSSEALSSSISPLGISDVGL